jgi:hypothetical protein
MQATYCYPVLGGSVQITGVNEYEQIQVLVQIDRDGKSQRVELSATGARALASALEAAALVTEDEP